MVEQSQKESEEIFFSCPHYYQMELIVLVLVRWNMRRKSIPSNSTAQVSLGFLDQRPAQGSASKKLRECVLGVVVLLLLQYFGFRMG
jgi:hypothetical protein